MADRRMITRKVTDDDHFIALSSSAQALYLHLNMSADDDGFCNQISTAMFRSHASVQDLEALLEKRFLLQFDSGVIVIKHWRMANALRKDRYTPTAFQEEMSKLKLKDNGSYTMEGASVASWLPDGCQVVTERLPQVRLGKDSIGKDSIGKVNETISVDMVCSTDVQRVIERWNSLGLGQVNKVVAGTDRERLLKKRIKDYGIDEVLRAIENVRESKFLNGGNSKGWIITFDWFIRPNNFPKVLDGNYAKSSSGSKLDESYAMMERWASNDEG